MTIIVVKDVGVAATSPSQHLTTAAAAAAAIELDVTVVLVATSMLVLCGQIGAFASVLR